MFLFSRLLCWHYKRRTWSLLPSNTYTSSYPSVKWAHLSLPSRYKHIKHYPDDKPHMTMSCALINYITQLLWNKLSKAWPLVSVFYPWQLLISGLWTIYKPFTFSFQLWPQGSTAHSENIELKKMDQLLNGTFLCRKLSLSTCFSSRTASHPAYFCWAHRMLH